MRIDTAFFPPAAVGASPSAGVAGPDFAELLGLSSPAQTAEALLMSPTREDGDPQRARQAYSFGAFGLFPPGFAQGLSGADEAALNPAAATAPAADLPLGPGATDAPEVSGEAGAVGPGLSAEAARGEAEAAAAARRPAFPEAGGVTEIASIAPNDDDPAPAAAPARRPPRPAPPRRPDPVHLILVEEAGGLGIVAAAGGLAPVDHDQARTRLRDAAARLGTPLGEVQLNGLTGRAPEKAGDRHGFGAG